MSKSFFAMRNPSSLSSHSQNLCHLSWFFALLLLLLCFFFSTTKGSAAEISYSDHCASAVAESEPTARVSSGLLYFDLTRSYYWGGNKIFGKFKNPSDQFLNDSQTYVSFSTRNVYETSTSGIYKVEAYLLFRSPRQYTVSSTYSGYGYNYQSRRVNRRRESLRFLLNGFWSEHSRKLCMVGAASWQPGESKSLKLKAVFELSYAKQNSTLLTSLAKGSLKSLSSSNSPSYFENIVIVSFPTLDHYNYTLASKGLAGGCLGGIPSKKPHSLQHICNSGSFPWYNLDFELEYAAGCKSTRDCGPFEGNPAYLSLYQFQCSDGEDKQRYMISFESRRYDRHRGTFDPKRALIGEGSWDTNRNQLCIVACRIVNPFKSIEDAHVGDCSIRLSLRFPVVWTINDTSSVEGLVWTNKTGTDPGYFKNITFTSSSSNSYEGMRLPGLRYEYTKTEMAKKLCPRSQVVKKSGEKYPRGNSYDMRFDMSVKHSKDQIGWGNAVPITVDEEFFGERSITIMDSDYGEEEENSSYSGHVKVSYKLMFFSAFDLENKSFPVNSSLNNYMEINAEGAYDAETGHLCMVGCRIHLHNQSKKSQDCELFMEFQFPPLNSKVGSSIQGFIQSRRRKDDPLYFDLWNISASSYYGIQAKESIWRMDLEIVLVLISNTLLCLFVASQIFYVKKHPEVLPFISLVMLGVLTLGHMIPLVLNLETLLLNNSNQQKLILGGEGWLAWNELSVRLVNLVVFLLLLRLLQMAWTARTENGDGKHFWGAEKKTVFVTLLLYAVGGVVTLLVEWGKNGIGNGMFSPEYPQRNGTLSLEYPQQSSTLKYLKSYAGLVLDGFLLPQILLNIFQNSRENALSCLFYSGTTLVRLLPHAYDLYRVHYYMRQGFDSSYIYANPNADFYSIAWDVIIPCGCILFAGIIWLQQRFGGRCFLPRKIQELGSYEKVPVVSNE